MLIALFVSILIVALLTVGYIWLLDRHDEDRRRWSRSVPTITHLPRATARDRKSP